MDSMDCLIIFIIVTPIVAFNLFIFYQQRKNEKAAWRQMAATYHLNFVSNNNFFSISKGACFNGIYRDHPLVLEITTKREAWWRESLRTGKESTRIKVYVHSQLANKPPDQNQPNPPLPFQEAIEQFNKIFVAADYQIKTELNGSPFFYYEQQNFIKDAQYLERLFDRLTNLAEAYTVIVAQGGEAIPILQPALKNKDTRQTVLQLVKEIASDTYKRLAHRAHRLLCPRCLTRFGPHTLHLPWYKDLVYYGCRMCSQSREFYEGSVVAILDNQATDTPVQQNDTLALRIPSGITLPLLVNVSYPVGDVRVNWSTHQKLFDFDTVEIIQATDEEAERFAVQIGNDTDETRKARYQEMQCVVHPNCQLSENTLRILRRTFGQVVSGEESKLKDKPINRLSDDEKSSEQETTYSASL